MKMMLLSQLSAAVNYRKKQTQNQYLNNFTCTLPRCLLYHHN